MYKRQGLSVDILSDITTNLIRPQLIEFTQKVCKKYGIPLVDGVVAGPMWNTETNQWDLEEYASLPMPSDEKLLLVPKSIVRLTSTYNVSTYYRHYILPFLEQVEISAGSGLVQIVKSGPNKGKSKVFKTDLSKKYGSAEKEVAIEQSLKHPQVLRNFINENGSPPPPASHAVIADLTNSGEPDWQTLISNLTDLSTGRKDAYKYEIAIEALLNALFYPDLVDPERQTRQDNGRKIVDITYTNYAQSGFFWWLSKSVASSYIFVECKNYSGDIGNEEIDQLLGRLDKKNGMFGLLLVREISNQRKIFELCKAALNRHDKYIIVITDAILAELVTEAQDRDLTMKHPTLRSLFKKLSM